MQIARLNRRVIMKLWGLPLCASLAAGLWAETSAGSKSVAAFFMLFCPDSGQDLILKR